MVLKILLFISIFVLVVMVWELMFPDHEKMMIERLEGFNIYSATEHERKKQESLFARIYHTLESVVIRRFGNHIAKGGALAPLQLKLYQSGSDLDPIQFRAKRFIYSFVLAGLAMFSYNYKLVIIVAVIGFIFPDYQLRKRIDERKFKIKEEIPDFVDLLASVFPGCNGFEDAVTRICARTDTIISREFQITMDQINTNVNKKEALRAMGVRCGIAAVDGLVGQIIQTEMLGTEMADTLKIQAVKMRELKRQNSEIKARNASLMLLMPSIFLMITILIVIVGPSILQFMQAMGGF